MNETFKSLLLELGTNVENYPEKNLTSFMVMKGDDFSGELVVVGRSVNGWRTEWLKEDSIKRLNEIAAQSMQGVISKDRCPMMWVTDLWGKGENYRTSRSAFWRVIREVVRRFGLADVSDPNWPSVLAWSNLYKVSPAEAGNPSQALRQIQFPHCAQLLKAELSSLKPRRILMLTGLGWARPFLKDLPVHWDKVAGKTCVEATGSFEFPSGQRGHLVVAKHPQGKKESVWVKEVLEAFRS